MDVSRLYWCSAISFPKYELLYFTENKVLADIAPSGCFSVSPLLDLGEPNFPKIARVAQTQRKLGAETCHPRALF